METINDLSALLLHYIDNLSDAEKQIMEAMPAIIQKAKHQSLKNALQHHLSLSKEHNNRLQKVFSLLDKENKTAKTGKHQTNITSKGIKGLLEEANELLNNDIDEDVNDAAIIGCVQKIEHYEICSYGTALAYAQQLQLHEAEVLLKETLDEEYDFDDLLTALATAALNKEALPEGAAAKSSDSTADENTGDNTMRKATPVTISEKNVQSPGGRAGTSHRGYSTGESRGH
jgi:ferritin-like metal-binding protein YciE